MRALMDLADRIVVLHHGELIASGRRRHRRDPCGSAGYFGGPEP